MAHTRHSSTALWVWIVGVATLAPVALAGLPSNAYYTGDSGAKLIAARNAIAHPDRPTEIDLPTIAGQPRPDVEQFFVLHGTHAHFVQSALFPLLSAPFVAIFGLHGAFVLPMVSFLLLFPALDVVRRRRFGSVSPWVLAVVILTSPLVFYALEFWEHSPAVTMLAICMAIVTPRHGVSTGNAAIVGAGAAAGIAILLRPESAWFVLAIGLLWMPLNAFFRLSLGVFVPLGLFAAWNIVHGNSPLGTHVAANLSVPSAGHWLSMTGDRAALWVLPQQATGLVAGLLLAVAYVVSARQSQWSVVIAACGVLLVALLAVSRQLPREQILSVWPVGLMALFPVHGSTSQRQLRSITLLTVVAILFSATNDGGAQWGPRYLLVAMPAWLMLVATHVSGMLTAEATVRKVGIALCVLLVCCSLAVTRHAYRDLRGTKRIYSQLVERIDRGRQDSGYIVTDVWWVDQVAASLYGEVTFLFERDQTAAGLALRSLQDAGVQKVTVVAAATPGSTPLMDAARTTCYKHRDVTRLEPHDLTLAVLECDPSAGNLGGARTR